MVETIKGVPVEVLQDILRRAIEEGEVRSCNKKEGRLFHTLASWGQLSTANALAGRYVITERGRVNYAAMLNESAPSATDQNTEPRR